MQLIKPYLKKGIFTAGYIFLLLLISNLLLMWGNSNELLNFLNRKNKVLEEQVEQYENKFTEEEVVCEKGNKETICNLNGMRVACDTYEYSATKDNPNCSESECLFNSIYGMEGFARLRGYFKPVIVSGGYGESECAGFVVVEGSNVLIANCEARGHIILGDNGERMIKLAVPGENFLKQSDRDLLLASSADNLVDLSILKRTPPQKGVEGCYSDYVVVNVNPYSK